MNDYKSKEHVCGVLIADMSSCEDAIKCAHSMKNCPHLIASGVNSNEFIGIYIVPKEITWWLKIPEEQPEVMGAIKVQCFITDCLIYPENFKLRLIGTKSEIAPCGANCLECPLKEEYQCPCCPASIYYKMKINTE